MPKNAMEDRAERPLGMNGEHPGSDDAAEEEAPRRTTGEVRVVAVEAAVAAGLVEATPEPAGVESAP